MVSSPPNLEPHAWTSDDAATASRRLPEHEMELVSRMPQRANKMKRQEKKDEK